MVSSTINSSAKTTSLSYAERAKKAQNTGSSAFAPPQSTVAQLQSTSPARIRNPSTSTLSFSNPTTPRSVDVRSGSSVSLTVGLSSQSPQPLASDAPNHFQSVNGNTHTAQNLASDALSIVAIHAAQKTPVANIWNLRKEQLAAARSAPHHTPSIPGQDPSLKGVMQDSQTVNALPSSSSLLDAAPNSPHAHGPLPMTPSRGVTPPEAPDDDPFVVRVPRVRPHIPLYSTQDDKESWPEVGQAVSPASRTAAPITQTEPKLGSNDEAETPPASTARKSEKIKWVPIPPEELQAAVDAAKSSSRHHRHHHLNGFQPSNSNPQSRAHSGHSSATQSVSHSRVESRSASAQSTPISRSQYLPAENLVVTGASGYDRAHRHGFTNRPQRTISPNFHMPPQPSAQSYTIPHPDAGIVYPTPRYSEPENGLTNYYPRQQVLPVPPVPQRYRNSSSYSPHLPPTGYSSYAPSQSNSPPPPPHTYLGIASYPMQPGYGLYDYNVPPVQLYPYRNGHITPDQEGPSYPPHHPFPTHLQQHAPPPQRGNVATSDTDVPPPAMTTLPPAPEQSQTVTDHREIAAPGERRGRPVVFGSIDIPGGSQVLSPTANGVSAVAGVQRAFQTFSVGVAPGESAPLRMRSRTQSSAHKRITAVFDVGVYSTTSEGTNGEQEVEGGRLLVNGQTKVIKLTGPETAFEFGTAGLHAVRLLDLPQLDSLLSRPRLAHGPLPGADTKPNPLLLPTEDPDPTPFPLPSAHTPLNAEEQGVNDEFVVKDYGFGFGSTARTIAPVREDREEIEKSRGIDQGGREQDHDRDLSRPRRGSYGGGFDRGGYGGRRGRGMLNRGYHRGFYRGGFHQTQPRQPPFNITPPPLFQPLMPPGDPMNALYRPPRQQLATYIPAGFDGYQRLSPPSAPAPPSVTQPVPVPRSSLPFPLDSTRWYLLGQLEYYLSSQNMAQDFFLRQRMDSKGWIPIALIASFNRVRSLTSDIQLVRDVLVLSSLVQVRDDWVRMGGWENFVLPDAAPSTVESVEHGVYQPEGQPNADKSQTVAEASQMGTDNTGDDEGEGDEDGEIDGEMDDEDDEEDVVFVMGHETGLWSPERQA